MEPKNIQNTLIASPWAEDPDSLARFGRDKVYWSRMQFPILVPQGIGTIHEHLNQWLVSATTLYIKHNRPYVNGRAKWWGYQNNTLVEQGLALSLDKAKQKADSFLIALGYKLLGSKHTVMI